MLGVHLIQRYDALSNKRKREIDVRLALTCPIASLISPQNDHRLHFVRTFKWIFTQEIFKKTGQRRNAQIKKKIIKRILRTAGLAKTNWKLKQTRNRLIHANFSNELCCLRFESFQSISIKFARQTQCSMSNARHYSLYFPKCMSFICFGELRLSL